MFAQPNPVLSWTIIGAVGGAVLLLDAYQRRRRLERERAARSALPLSADAPVTFISWAVAWVGIVAVFFAVASVASRP